MNQEHYEITVRGTLDPSWREWLELEILPNSQGETVLCGKLKDQAALWGVLIKLRDLGLTLRGLRVLPLTALKEPGTVSKEFGGEGK
jgi:hypothetical protein